jgi:hypothetical protein
VLASAAAGSVFEMGDIVHGLKVFGFFIFRNVFVFFLWFPQAAACCLTIVSALVPMAQMKPSSSRVTAVTIFLWSLPAAPSFI